MTLEALGELFHPDGLHHLLATIFGAHDQVSGTSHAVHAMPMSANAEETKNIGTTSHWVFEASNEAAIDPSPAPGPDVIPNPPDGTYAGRVVPGHPLPKPLSGFHYELRTDPKHGPDYVWIVPDGPRIQSDPTTLR